MTRKYVEIRYTDAVERVPLHDPGELRRILEERGSYVSYSIHSHWWYGLLPHGKNGIAYRPMESPQGEDVH